MVKSIGKHLFKEDWDFTVHQKWKKNVDFNNLKANFEALCALVSQNWFKFIVDKHIFASKKREK